MLALSPFIVWAGWAVRDESSLTTAPLIALVWVAVLVLSALSIAMYLGVSHLERVLLRRHPLEDEAERGAGRRRAAHRRAPRCWRA